MDGIRWDIEETDEPKLLRVGLLTCRGCSTIVGTLGATRDDVDQLTSVRKTRCEGIGYDDAVDVVRRYA